MKSSLIPEKPILVYPSLAATVGLEEAIMLSVLTDVTRGVECRERNGYMWFDIKCCELVESTPFWQIRDIQRVSNSLRDKGVLLLGANIFGNDPTFRFAFNEKAKLDALNQDSQTQSTTIRNTVEPRGSAPSKESYPSTPFGKNFIAPTWQPQEDTLAQLSQLNIPSHFALEHVPAFVTYWRDRGEPQRSWESKFLQHIMFQWRAFETQQNKKDQESAMHADWRPSEDAKEVLICHAEISKEFVEDAIPEFVLYWQERGDVTRTWNSKFIQHVRLQWKKYHSALESSTDPKPIPKDWQPSEDVYDVLRFANIDVHFARKMLPEFVIYWLDSRQAHTSWNTRFLQHIKKQWARQHSLNIQQGDVNTPGIERSTREISLEEKLTDRSWAQH